MLNNYDSFLVRYCLGSNAQLILGQDVNIDIDWMFSKGLWGVQIKSWRGYFWRWIDLKHGWDESGISNVENPDIIIAMCCCRTEGNMTSGEQGQAATVINAAGQYIPLIFLFARKK